MAITGWGGKMKEPKEYTKAGSDREWRVKSAELGLRKHKIHCHRCGVLFAAWRVDAKYCGSACRQAAHRDRRRRARIAQAIEHPTPLAEHKARRQEITDRRLATKRAQVIEYSCRHCGRQFQTDGTGTGRLYCSNACRQAAYRARKAAKRLAAELEFIRAARAAQAPTCQGCGLPLHDPDHPWDHRCPGVETAHRLIELAESGS